MSPDIATALRRLREHLYSGKPKQVIQWLGLNRLLSGPFWWLVYRTSSSRSCHVVGGHEATFAVGSSSEYHRFENLSGEKEIIADMLESMTETDVFYDIGANVGTYTCFAVSKVGSNRVVAFEPEPQNIDRLAYNLALNDSTCSVVGMALTDYDGTAELELQGTEAGEGTHTITTDTGRKSITVPARRVDSAIEECGLTPPSVVKIDVEGAELSVLRGMEETLRTHCRLVYVEVHGEQIRDSGIEADDVRKFLESRGFAVTELIEREGQRILRATK